MTFAQLLHRVLDHYFGDEAFERRQRRQIEKIRERLRGKVYEEVFDEAFTAGWMDVPEAIRLRLPDDSRERIRQRVLARRPAMRGNDASA
ncbi:MAG: hypothetical protein F4X66_16250 [Chloroflexi bacterium]|nr:hypothetical protein [Chloroflexota bacterium]MYE41329.1 hypothetical protein [Chloroflexota bacterium]